MARRHETHVDAGVQSGTYGLRTVDNTMPILTELVRRGADVLDVGCGPGTITLGVAALASGGEVIGVDVETTAVQKATTAAAQNNVANARFVVGSAYRLPFDKGRFDVVYSHNVLEWLSNAAAAVQEMIRVCRPGGTVLLQDAEFGLWVLYPPVPSFSEWIRATERLSALGEQEQYSNRHFGRQLYSLARKCGLQDISVRLQPRVVHGPEEAPRNWDAWLQHFRLEGPYGRLNRRMIELGLMSEATLSNAVSEFELWMKDPFYFSAGCEVAAWGHTHPLRG